MKVVVQNKRESKMLEEDKIVSKEKSRIKVVSGLKATPMKSTTLPSAAPTTPLSRQHLDADFDQSNPSKSKSLMLSQIEMRKNQTFMTIAHYILNYPRYSISLFILLATRSLPLPTWEVGVTQPWSAIQIVTKDERRLYLECTRHVFDGLEQELNKTATIEVVRSGKVHEDNENSLQEAIYRTEICSNASELARQALITWKRINDGWYIWKDSNDTCPVEEQHQLADWLESDVVASQKQMITAWDSFTSASMASFENMADYAGRRSTYDYNYFIGIKIQGLINLLDDFPVATLPTLTYNLTNELQLEMQNLFDAFSLLKAQIDLLRIRLTEYHTSLEAFYLNYIELRNRLQLARAYIIDFLPNPAKLPSFFNISDLPTADFLLPKIFTLPTFPDLPDIQLLVSDTIVRILALIARLVALLAEEAADELRAILIALYEALQQLTILKDYDPPKYVGSQAGIYNVQDERIFLGNYGAATNRDIDEWLRRSQPYTADTSSIQTNPPDVQVQSPDIGSNATTFPYLTPKFLKFSMPNLIKNIFSFILRFQWLIEIVVQLMRLFRLKRKYERSATPDLPEIDLITATDEDDEEEKEKAKAARLAMIKEAVLSHLLTPWLLVAMLVLPFFLFGILVWVPHVRHNCQKSRNGTFLARNMITPMMINKANFDGNAYHVFAEQQCRKTQWQLCNTLYADSESKYQENMQTLSLTQSQFNESVHDSDILLHCVNITSLDESFENSCCGLEGYVYNQSCTDRINMCAIDYSGYAPTPYRPLSEYLDSANCYNNEPSWQLNDERFQCQSIEDMCSNFPCTGVDENYMKYIIIECDCNIEIYIMQLCLLILLTLYHAIMVNLCTTLVLQGTKRICWKKLKADGLKMRTQVTAQGEFIKGGDLEERMRYINATMRRFELVGYVQIVAGSVLFVFWFVSFFTLRKTFSIY